MEGCLEIWTLWLAHIIINKPSIWLIFLTFFKTVIQFLYYIFTQTFFLNSIFQVSGLILELDIGILSLLFISNKWAMAKIYIHIFINICNCNYDHYCPTSSPAGGQSTTDSVSCVSCVCERIVTYGREIFTSSIFFGTFTHKWRWFSCYDLSICPYWIYWIVTQLW